MNKKNSITLLFKNIINKILFLKKFTYQTSKDDVLKFTNLIHAINNKLVASYKDGNLIEVSSETKLNLQSLKVELQNLKNKRNLNKSLNRAWGKKI